MHWKTENSPRMKKARQSKSKFKATLIVFIDIKGLVMEDWISEGLTRINVNQYCYKRILEKLRKKVQ